jgi:hypothetical protein
VVVEVAFEVFPFELNRGELRACDGVVPLVGLPARDTPERIVRRIVRVCGDVRVGDVRN